MGKIQRYSIKARPATSDRKEDPAGEWVRWADVKDIIKGGQCNCEEYGFVKTVELWEPWEWLCPAHGYKSKGV